MGGKSPQPVVQKNTVELGPEQREIFNLAMPFIRQYATTNPDFYRGPTLAGFDPNEVTAQNMYLQQAAPQGQNLANASAAANLFLMDPRQLSHETNPYIGGMADTITDRVTSNFTQKILPHIRDQSRVAEGMFAGGSTRSGLAEVQGAGNTADALTKGLNDLYFQNYRLGAENMARGIQMNPSVQAQQLFGADLYGAVGSQRRALEQAQMDENARRFTLEQQLPFLRASELLGLISGMPGATGVSTVQGANPQVSPFRAGFGGALSGAGLGSMFGPIGMLLGALGGGLGGYFMNR